MKIHALWVKGSISHFLSPLLLLLILLFLTACTAGETAGAYEGNKFGNLPLLEGSVAAQEAVTGVALRQVRLAHAGTVQQPHSAYFTMEQPLVETIDRYDTAMQQLDWNLVDVLEFGDGGFLRRYHNGDERAILAFHPQGEARTEFLLLYGTVQN